MKSIQLIATLLLATTTGQGLLAQSSPAAQLVGHWLNRNLEELEHGKFETHTLILREADGKLQLKIFTITHAEKTSTLEVKHGRWVLNDATYTETFPARGETDDYGVVAITDADFRYTYQDEEDTSVELRDEKIDARRFAPPPLPAGYHKVDYELWDPKDPADLNHEKL